MSRNNRQRIAKKSSNPVQRLMRETIGELRKVSWPTTRETISLSKVVLAVLVAMAVFMGTLDFLLVKVVAVLVR